MFLTKDSMVGKMVFDQIANGVFCRLISFRHGVIGFEAPNSSFVSNHAMLAKSRQRLFCGSLRQFNKKLARNRHRRNP
jgi:hypothetical protein